MPSSLFRWRSVVWPLLFLAAVSLNFFFPGDDPHRCRAVATTGRWLDPLGDDGERHDFRHWQPDGCMLHPYSSEDIRRCMEGRRIVFVGDSQSRHVAWGLGRLLEREEARYDSKHTSNSKPFNVTYHGVELQRYGNVFLNTGDDNGHPDFVSHFIDFANDRVADPSPSIEKQQGPALIYISAGVWYSNHLDGMDHDAKIEAFRGNYSKLDDYFSPGHKNIFTDSMDPIDGVGNQVFYGPPSGPFYTGDRADAVNRQKEKKQEAKEKDAKDGKKWTDKDSAAYDKKQEKKKSGRRKDIGRRLGEVGEMKDWLKKEEDGLNMPIIWNIPGMTVGQNYSWKNDGTGFHVIDPVAETRANILLNMRCNAKLDREKSYPYNRTCCTDYGVKPLVQLGAVLAGLACLVVCLVFEVLDIVAGRDKPRFMLLNMKVGTFFMAPLMCYFADRTQMMAKGSKVWKLSDFFILCIPPIAIALFTIRRSRSSAKPAAPKEASRSEEQPEAPADEPFLARDQTDEWKGWMQFIILIYHWTNATYAPIYIVVRVLVAAYLFQTGYGHTLFFLNKKDFSFNRVASVLLRLNLLTCALAYVMDTDWMFYYFSPLVSFWFLVVYATMAVGHKRCNDNVQLVLTKILLSAMLVSSIILGTPANRWLFQVLRFAFNIQWSYNEWQYRVTLDLFIVYIGMCVAIAYTRVKVALNILLRIALAIAGFITMVHFFNAAATAGSEGYKKWHPYISFVPIMAFIALRNVSGPVRNFHSKGMAWLGRCSLETYTLQFHLLLAADTRGVLLVDGFFGDSTLLGDRWRDLLIIVPIFLAISSATATATTQVVKAIMYTSPEQRQGGEYIKLMSTEEMEEEAAYEATDNGRGRTGSALSKAGRWWRNTCKISRVSSYITAPMVRIFLMLLAMWLLNLLSPSHVARKAPDGFTPHRVGPAPPMSTPTPTPRP